MSDEHHPSNPLVSARGEEPLSSVIQTLADLKGGWEREKIEPYPAPIVGSNDNAREAQNYSEPEWISGWRAFEILRVQTEPHEWAPPLARIAAIISDQNDRDESGLNYAMQALPPSHVLLDDFTLGSNQWFCAAWSLLKQYKAEKIDGWENFVSDLYDWIGPYGDLRIRTNDVLSNALYLDWPYIHYSLPEAKQDPIWSFPKAMAWIATRDYLPMARLGVFRRPSNGDEAVATEGVCRYNTAALGWLHTLLSYSKCECGALKTYKLEALEHCTCISKAWEELVHFNGGLSPQTPELVFNLQEGWLSMTWPDGADDFRFLRRDILEQWPAPSAKADSSIATTKSTTTGEQECREWLMKEFEADPEKLRSKKAFRNAALERFEGRISERGFNLRVWPELAREHGRDSAGAKRKS